MKEANVKPLFKKNNSLDVGNNRPVIILSIVSKFLACEVNNNVRTSV